MRATRKRAVRPAEAGYALLGVIFLLFLLTISLTVAGPRVIKDLEHEREIETEQRGKQYMRAIELYYRKFHNFPPTIEALNKTNNIRYLRKQYADPVTGKKEWKLIHYGQAKTQTLGFFGKPISGGGGMGGFGGGIGPTGGSTGPLFGGDPTNPSAQSISDTVNTTDPSGGQGAAGQGAGGQSGSGDTSGSTSGSGSTGTGTTGTSGSSSSSSSSFGSGQTFGGGGIIGVSPNSPKQTVLVYRKKFHYNEWEFIYDPALERYYGSGAGGLQQNGSLNGNALGSGNSSNSFGNSFSNSNNSNGNSSSNTTGSSSQ